MRFGQNNINIIYKRLPRKKKDNVLSSELVGKNLWDFRYNNGINLTKSK
jgi:hypothetical protein